MLAFPYLDSAREDYNEGLHQRRLVCKPLNTMRLWSSPFQECLSSLNGSGEATSKVAIMCLRGSRSSQHRLDHHHHPLSGRSLDFINVLYARVEYNS